MGYPQTRHFVDNNIFLEYLFSLQYEIDTLMYWLTSGHEYMKRQHYPEAIKAYVISMRNKELKDVKDAVSLGRLSVVNEDKRKIYVTLLKNLQLCHFKLVSEVRHFFYPI